MAELVVHVPQGINVAFKGVDTVANMAIPAGNDPCPVTEGYISNLLDVAPGDGLTCIFLISASMADCCDRRHVSRQRAQQRITEAFHFVELTMNDELR